MFKALKVDRAQKMSWQRAGGREGAENGFHVTLTAVAVLDLIVGGNSSVGEHHVTTPAMPWWSRLSHPPPPPASPLLNRGAAAHRTKYEWKGQVAFSPLCVPKVVPCRCDRYERQGCIFVSRHYEFKISQTLLLFRISQTSKFLLTQW